MLRPPSRYYSSLAVALAACASLSACQRAEEEAAEPDARPVHSITIEKQDAGDVVVLSGRIAAEDETAVAFRIPGRMIDRPVNVGDRVRKGQVLARLEQMNERNQLLTAQAALNAARAERVRCARRAAAAAVADRRGVHDPGQPRHGPRRVPRPPRRRSRVPRRRCRWREDLVGFTVLTAEFDGSVTARGAEPGEVVQGGQMILRIARAGGTDAVFEVPPQVLRVASRETPVEVALTEDPRVRATGLVREVSPQANPITGTFTVRVGLARPAARHAARFRGIRPHASSRVSNWS